MKLIIYRAATLLSISLLVSSCSTEVKKLPDEPTLVTTPVEAPETEAESAEKLVEQGKLMEAANLYLKMAAKAEQSERPTYQLKAAQLLLQLESSDAAENIITNIEAEELSTSQKTQLTYLQLQIALNARQAEKSLSILNELKTQNYDEFATEAEILNLSIRTYELLNNTKQATISRIQLEPFLLEDQAITNNQITIIRELLTLETEELNLISASTTNQMVKSWIDLALLIKKSKNPFRLTNMLTSWKSLNPQHSLRDEVIAVLAPQFDIEAARLDNIALLLPLTGTYAKAGSAVRDGFLTGYYSEELSEEISASKPSITLYDTASGKNLSEIYQEAINEGANIIVGPLRKEAVSQIALHAQDEIPILALNNLEDNNFYHHNFFQFALSPEAEAKQIAQRAWLDGHNHAAVMFPDNKWGKRLAEAFIQEWEVLGGSISAQSSYNAKKNDFSKSIKSLLAIDQSEMRKRELAKLLRTKIRFAPRRRQDIDMIFMASLPRQARLIPPQLKFYHAEKLPIYTTSHSFSGRFNRKSDTDLNGIVIADMPWTLNRSHMEPMKKQIYRIWPNKTKQFNRLYAFGSDAYNILNYLIWLRSTSNAHLQGATGELYMNERNQIMRILSWAKFRSGIPKLLATTTKPVIKSE